MKTLVILPTYNEAENLDPILQILTQKVKQVDILIVDDNSPDGTGRLADTWSLKHNQVFVLHRKKKEGLSAAYIAGMSWGLEKNYDVFIEMDADLSHDPLEVFNFLQKLKTYDAVIGCRYMVGGKTQGWSSVRNFISRGGNWYAQNILKLPYLDLTGGYNAWRREVLLAIDIKNIRSKGYAFQVELKYRAHKKGFKILEIPICFTNRKKGYSKMSSNIVWEAALRVLQMRLHKFCSV